jgi:hypothetical protein
VIYLIILTAYKFEYIPKRKYLQVYAARLTFTAKIARMSSELLDRSYFTDTVSWQTHARDAYHHLSIPDLEILDTFIAGLSARATERNDDDEGADIVDFLTIQNIELNVLAEKGHLVIVMFLEFFKYLENVEKLEAKYASLESFLACYDKFSDRSLLEQNILWATANWVSNILKYIPAKRNKGSIICIVPKYVEGLQARYVTGSGQTAATNDRVFIYESEGAVIRAHRIRPSKVCRS